MAEERDTQTDEAPPDKMRKFLGWVNKTDLVTVVAGGATGGFLMPLVRKFLKSEAPFRESIQAPEFYDAWFLAALLGVICAGVVVYTLSYSDNNNRRQVFFISLLAGLTFPGFLSGALDIEAAKEKIDETVMDAKVAGAAAADKSNTPEETEVLAEKSADLLVKAVNEAGANSLNDLDRQNVEIDTKEALDSIAAAAVSEDGKINEAIALQVEQVVTAAEIQGYEVAPADSVAKGVLDSLAEQREADRDNARKLLGPRP
ncbi:MAG: hypothetical protein V3V15_12100 [Sphingorhabdus sp.]